MSGRSRSDAITAAEFLAAGARPGELPAAGPPEVAFAGRSNVGKSSLINALVGRRGLVRTSNTPGRTQTLNLFRVATRGLGELWLCDLPGYGFARVARSLREQWGHAIEGYLRERTTLRAVVVIADARRALEPDDLGLVDWLVELGRRPLVVVTKSDKLPKARRRPALDAAQAALAGRAGRPLLFSAVTGEGRDELWTRILAACAAGPVD